MYGRQHTVTTPVIKWAQTKQKLFINFKLSHRQDSPPCSDARGEVFGVWGIGEVFGKFQVQKHDDLTNDNHTTEENGENN